MNSLALRQLFTESLTLPRAAARRVLGFEVELSVALAAGVAVVIASTLLGVVMQMILPLPEHPVSAFLVTQPIAAAAAQFAALIVMALLTTIIGRWFGGTGGFPGAMALLVWMQVVMLGLQFVQFVTLIFSPVLAAFINVAATVWFFWALSAFIAELHGFRKLLNVLGGVFISMFVVLLAVGILLVIAGVTVPQMV